MSDSQPLETTSTEGEIKIVHESKEANATKRDWMTFWIWGVARSSDISGPIREANQEANLAYTNTGDDWSKRKHLQSTRSIEHA